MRFFSQREKKKEGYPKRSAGPLLSTKANKWVWSWGDVVVLVICTAERWS